jgi:transient receptor potential cation channel subfamily A protein 1
VESILPDTLEEFLDDDCIDGNGIITDEEFSITFRYDFLAPPILNENMAIPKNEEEAEEFAANDDPTERALPETEALWYLSVASKEHKALLKHPVIASFLWLKWQRIRTLFYFNLLLYVTFVLLLTAFIFLRFGGYSVQVNVDAANNGTDKEFAFNHANKTVVGGLTAAITFLCFLLLLREAFQILVSFKRYFFNPENLMELAIVTLALVIMYGDDEDGNFEVDTVG